MMQYLALPFLLLLIVSGCKTESRDGNASSGNIDPDYTAASDPYDFNATDACQQVDSAWHTVSDEWSTTEGHFSDDLALWVRSRIPTGDTRVTLFYQYAGDFRESNEYIALGAYAVEGLTFDMQVSQDYLGSVSVAPFFYVGIRGNCYRGEFPPNGDTVPNKTLVEINGSGYVDANDSVEDDTDVTDSNTSFDPEDFDAADACPLDDDIVWQAVSDAWSTTEGQFSTDKVFWLRSEITSGDTVVTLFYQNRGGYSGNSTYLSLGTYSVDELKFSMQVNQGYLDSNSTMSDFYVGIRGKCYRGELPGDVNTPPSKELVEVTQP